MSMKKLLSLLLAIAMVFSLAGCAEEAEENEEIVVPPVRFGTATAMLEGPYSIEEATTGADAVARVRIGNWLGENAEQQCTYFEAAPIEVVKGELPENVVLMQDGYSSSIYERYPLFTYGNEVFLFLKTAVGDQPFENVFWIYGSYGTVFYVGADADEISYATPNSANYMCEGDGLDNHAIVSTRSEVLASLSSNDPEVWRADGLISRTFLLDDLVESVNAAHTTTVVNEEVNQ